MIYKSKKNRKFPKKNKTYRKKRLGGDSKNKRKEMDSAMSKSVQKQQKENDNIVIELSDPDMYFMMLNMLGHDPIHDFSGDRPHSVIKAVNELTKQQNIQKGGGPDDNDYLNDDEYIDLLDNSNLDTPAINDIIFQDEYLLKQIEKLLPEITIVKRSEDAPIAWRTRGNLSKLQLINEYIREFILKLCGYYYDGEIVSGGKAATKRIDDTVFDNSTILNPPSKSTKSTETKSEKALVAEESPPPLISQKIGKFTFGRYLNNIKEQKRENKIDGLEHNFMEALIHFTYELYNIVCSFERTKSFFHIIDTEIVYSSLLLYILSDEKKFPTNKYDLIIQIINSKYPDPVPDLLTPDRSTIRRTHSTPNRNRSLVLPRPLVLPNDEELPPLKKQFGGDITAEDIESFLEKLENKEEINTNTKIVKSSIKDKYNQYVKTIRNSKRTLSRIIIDDGEHVIRDIKTILSATLEKMNRTPVQEALTPREKETKNYVIKYIALGALNFINSPNKAHISSSTNKSLINFEIDRLGNISKEGKHISSYDKDLFDTYEKNLPSNNDPTINIIKKPLTEDYKKRSVVINNGVQNLHKSMDVICPYSSMADAQEAFGSCNNVDIEIGNINCIIQNEDGSSYYNAITKLNTKKRGNKEIKLLEMVTQTIFTEGNVMESKSLVDVTSPHVVKLKTSDMISNINKNKNDTVHTLSVKSSYLNIMKLLKEKFAEGNPWESFENINHYIDLIRVASRKGNGDIYQELNSVAENGGYVDTTIRDDKIRIGLSNDQPSGVRSGFLLLNAKEGINKKALAGFYGKGKTLVVGKNK